MNILLALDGSPNASESIEALAQFCTGPGKRVHLVVVCDPAVIAPKHISRDEATRIIDEARQSIATTYPEVAVSAEVLVGAPDAQIGEALERFEADMLMIGAHAPRPFPESLLGSVATHMARHADCTVRLLRKGCSGKRSMVCLDDSDVDTALIKEVLAMSWPKGSVLGFFSALDVPPVELSQNPRQDALLYYRLQNEQKAGLLTKLENYRRDIMAAHPHLTVDLSISDEVQVVEIILETARRWKAGTLIVGSHRRSGLDRLWLGSVSEKLAQQAQCSVHIVRARL